jgi:integrase
VGDILARQNHEKQPHPAVEWKNLPALVRDILHDGTVGTCREILEAAILTAARSKEIRGMKWEEIDFEERVWNVPAIRMKNKKLHQVPLSWRMIEILNSQKSKGLHSELVFPSPTGKVFSDNTLSKFLRDHKVKSDVPGRYATVHGFRSTFRTWGTDQQHDRDTLEKALAHTEKNDLVRTYSRTYLLEQRRKLMEGWADFVMGRTKATALVEMAVV